MGTIHGVVMVLALGWSVVTAILVVMLIYRAVLETHEDDQLFLDAAERSLENEQQRVVARIEKLALPITSLFVASAVLLVAAVGTWLWQGLANL